MNPFSSLFSSSSQRPMLPTVAPKLHTVLPCLAFLLTMNHVQGAVLINEVDSSTEQNSANREALQFIELRGAPGESLDGHVIALYNGANDSIYRTIDLKGSRIPADGLLVIGNPGVPGIDMVLPQITTGGNPQTAPNDDTIQPGPDGVALYSGVTPADFMFDPPGDAVPRLRAVTDPLPPGAAIVDALVYSSADPPPNGVNTPDAGLLDALTPGQLQINEGSTGKRLLRAIGRTDLPAAQTARNTTTYRIMTPTPGAENIGSAGPVAVNAEAITATKLFLEIADADLTVSEGDAAVTARVRLRNDDGTPALAPAGGLLVTLDSTDASEASGHPATVTIPAGLSVSPDFQIVPANDSWKDGGQIAFFHAATPGVGAHTTWLATTDDDADAPATLWPATTFGTGNPQNTLVITEVQGHLYEGPSPFPAGADANGDAVIDEKDQFVEITNTRPVAEDLSGLEVWVGSTPRHIFPTHTVLAPGQTILVLGGGVTDGSTAAFNGSHVYNASTGSLGIASGVDQIRIIKGVGPDLYEVAGFTAFTLQGGSHTRKAAITGTPDDRFGHRWNTQTGIDPITRSLATPELWASPAQTFAGVTVGTPEPAVLLTTNVSAAELKGPGAATLTITRPPGDENRLIAVLLTLRQTAAGGSLDSLQVQDGQDFLDDPTTASNDATDFADDPNIEELPVPFPAQANARTYCIHLPIGTASKTLTLCTRPDANDVDEVFAFSAITSFHRNTEASTPAALTVLERDTLTTAVVPPYVFTDAGNNAATLNLTIALDGRPAPAFPVTVNDLRSTSAEVTFAAATAALTNVVPNGSVGVNVNSVIKDNAEVTLTAIAATDDASAVPEAFNGEGKFTLVKRMLINEVAAGANPHIELVNNTGADINLNGWKILVNGAAKHTFAECSTSRPFPYDAAATSAVVPPRSALLVFETELGITPGITPANGTALVQVAGVPFGLAPGAVVTLVNGTGVVMNEYVYQGLAGSDSMLPDGVGVSRVTAAATPGTRNDGGGNFSTVATTMTLSFGRAVIAELAGPNAAMLTVTRSGPLDLSAEVCLTNTNPAAFTLTGEVAGKLIVNFAPGEGNKVIGVSPVDTTAGNGDRTSNVTSIAPGYLNGASPNLLVRDSDTIKLTLRAGSISENAGPNASLLTLTRLSPVGAVNFAIGTSGGPGAALRAPAPVIFNAGETSVTVPVDAVNDILENGSRVATFTAIADEVGGAINGKVDITIIDDGAVEAVYLNEIDQSQSGADNAEFVELFVPGGGGKSLSGYNLVLIDGTTNLPYSTIDLAGKTTDASGFFVVWDSGTGAGRFAPPGGIEINNTATGVALYRGAAGANLADNLVDALVVGGADAELQAALTPGIPLPVEAFKSEALPDGPSTIARMKIGGEAALLPADLRVAATWVATATTNRTPGFANGGILSGFNAWAQQFSGALDLPDADPDGDGMSNSVEYLLNLNPGTVNPIPLPVLNAGVATLTVPYNEDALVDPHLDSAVTWSADLLNWVDMPLKPGFTDQYELNPAPPKAFTRIEVDFIP